MLSYYSFHIFLYMCVYWLEPFCLIIPKLQYQKLHVVSIQKENIKGWVHYIVKYLHLFIAKIAFEIFRLSKLIYWVHSILSPKMRNNIPFRVIFLTLYDISSVSSSNTISFCSSSIIGLGWVYLRLVYLNKVCLICLEVIYNYFLSVLLWYPIIIFLPFS